MNDLKNSIKHYFLSESPFFRDAFIYKDDAEKIYLENWMRAEFSEKSTSAEILYSDDRQLSIHELIRKCSVCSDVYEKKFGFGSGKNSVMVILNAPQMLSAQEKNIFKNESIDMIKKIISSIKLALDECYITNMLKCEPRQLVSQRSNIFTKCSDILLKEINLYSPKVIIVMGELNPLRKIRNNFPDTDWFEIYHPITLLKNPDLKKETWVTLKYAMKRMTELKII